MSAALNASQKKACKDFKAICGASEKTALECCKRNAYNVERALDYFYTNPQLFESDPAAKAKSSGRSDKQKLQKLFDKYADPVKRDIMCDEPLGQFFKDVGVDPDKEGSVTLAFAYSIGCKTLGVIKRDEFVEGLAKLGKEEVKDIKTEIGSLRNRVTDRTFFRDFYKWLFDFIKEDAERKTIEMETAVEMLTTVLPPHFPLCTQFTDFLKQCKQKQFSKDNWDMTLEFAKDVKTDLSNYEEVGGAFPPIFDDFIAFMQRRARQGATGGGGAAAATAATAATAAKTNR
jgi:DCN1-like protein 1/2